jgi:hypothetical protein
MFAYSHDVIDCEPAVDSVSPFDSNGCICRLNLDYLPNGSFQDHDGEQIWPHSQLELVVGLSSRQQCLWNKSIVLHPQPSCRKRQKVRYQVD